MYLAIKNRGTLPRLRLKLFGISPKLDDTSGRTIGGKTSGAKLSPLPALRFGLDLHIASSDREGPYVLHYETETVSDGVCEEQNVVLAFNAPDGTPIERFQTQLTTRSFRDWDRPIGDDGNRVFKAVREHVANAFDEDPDFTISLADGPAPAAPGETVVYLRQTPEVEAIFKKPEHYFKFLARGPAGQPVVSVPGVGEAYPVADFDHVRLFIRGVLASCQRVIVKRPMFDYSLNDTTLLSEERVPRNQYECERAIGQLLVGVTDVQFARVILLQQKRKPTLLEADYLASAGQLEQKQRECWLSAVQSVYGAKVCVGTTRNMDEPARQNYGYEVIGNQYVDIGRFLVRLGIPLSSAIAPTVADSQQEYRCLPFAGFSADDQERFLGVWREFTEDFPERATLPIALLRPLTARTAAYAGISSINGKPYSAIGIVVNENTGLPPDESLLETIMHESAHCVTKANDFDRRFVDQVGRDALRIMYHKRGRRLPEEEAMPPPPPAPTFVDS
jgi:hypothetical protein